MNSTSKILWQTAMILSILAALAWMVWSFSQFNHGHITASLYGMLNAILWGVFGIICIIGERA